MSEICNQEGFQDHSEGWNYLPIYQVVAKFLVLGIPQKTSKGANIVQQRNHIGLICMCDVGNPNTMEIDYRGI